MEDHMVVRRPDDRLSFIPAKYMDEGYIAEPSASCIVRTSITELLTILLWNDT